MTPKRPRLRIETFEPVDSDAPAGADDAVPPPAEPAGPSAQPATDAAEAAAGKSYLAPSRRGLVAMPVYLPAAVRQQLKLLAVQRGISMNMAAAEALDLLFRKHHLPEIAVRSLRKDHR